MSDKAESVIGIHAVTELLNKRPVTVKQILLQSGRDDLRLNSIRELAQRAAVTIVELNRKEMDQRYSGVHQGVAAIVSSESTMSTEKDLLRTLAELQHEPLLLVLDGVTDPHNLGACLRTADAAGVDAVIIPKDKSASLNTTVRKVASGAAETVNLVAVTNLARCLQTLKEQGIWLVGTADDSEKSLFQQDLTGGIALVMGSEGSGLRRLTREHCDFLVSIPMVGELSSLNVSVAAGVCLYEARRQRIKQSK